MVNYSKQRNSTLMEESSGMSDMDKTEYNKQKYINQNGYNSVSSNGLNKIHDEVEEPVISLSNKESFEETPFYLEIITQIGLYILVLLAFVNEILFSMPKHMREKGREGYPPLYDLYTRSYLHYVFRRILDGWNNPLCSVPGAEIIIRDKVSYDNNWTFVYKESKTKYINLGSYNYLGFAQSSGKCAQDTIECIKNSAWATCSPPQELGTTETLLKLEKLVARFLGVDDAFVCGMGFATNSMNIPCIINKGCLVISDEKNHSSLIYGVKLSGATCNVFKHNDMVDLERRIRKAIKNGQPKSAKPWDKIFVMTEGIFSMDGSIVKLPELLELRKKYHIYVYLDEAHSVGAMGKNGRGVIDYYQCDSKEIDILMGTFTKSFASAGGYIAGSRKLIKCLRKHSYSERFANSMSPPIVQQIITSMTIIMGEDGTDEGKRRISQLARNTRYFRKRLYQLGCIVYGHEDSPVVPMLVYNLSKAVYAVREYLKHGIAAVGVGYPATPQRKARIRFCLSASHTKEHLDFVIDVTDMLADRMGLRYSKKPVDMSVVEY